LDRPALAELDPSAFASGQIRAQQIAPLPSPGDSQFLAIEGEGQRGSLLVERDFDQTPCLPGKGGGLPILLRKSAQAGELLRSDVLMQRQDWFAGQLDLDPRKLVFIDESGASTNLARKGGRCRRGRRLASEFYPELRAASSRQMALDPSGRSNSLSCRINQSSKQGLERATPTLSALQMRIASSKPKCSSRSKTAQTWSASSKELRRRRFPMPSCQRALGRLGCEPQ
jgi:hypothetical protein